MVPVGYLVVTALLLRGYCRLLGCYCLITVWLLEVIGLLLHFYCMVTVGYWVVTAFLLYGYCRLLGCYCIITVWLL